MDPELAELLAVTRSSEPTSPSSSSLYTHLSYFGPALRWNISQNKYSDFWSKYCNLAETDSPNLCLGEKIREDDLPIIINAIFKFPLNELVINEMEEDFLTVQFLMSMVQVIQDVLDRNLTLTYTHNGKAIELICAILKSENSWYEITKPNTSTSLITQTPDLLKIESELSDKGTNAYKCYKVRFQFPNCHTDLDFQNRVIRPQLISALTNRNLLNEDVLPLLPFGDWPTILEQITSGSSIPLYRSTTDLRYPKLILEYLVHRIDDIHLNASEWPILELDVFAFGNHTHVQKNLMGIDLWHQKPEYDYWLPLFLSLAYWPTLARPKLSADLGNGSSIGTSIGPSSLKSSTSLLSTAEEIQSCDNAEVLCEIFLPMLSNIRFTRDIYWVDVGKAIYTSFKGRREGLDLWIRYTQRHDVFSQEDCKERYWDFRDNSLSIQTLGWYALHDNPELYKDWHENWCHDAFNKATSGSHTDVAKAVYRLFWLKYRCSSISPNTFWEFREHRWVKLDHAVSLSKDLSDAFLKRIVNYQKAANESILSCEKGEERAIRASQAKQYQSLISKLQTVQFKGAVVREASELFYDEEFRNRVDSNPDLLGMKNGVIEVTSSSAFMRPGKPEDFVTMCTMLYYDDKINDDSPLMLKLMKWMRQAFTDKELLHYFLKLSASCLLGRNADKIFPIWTGEGDNSKSMIVKLFESTFGQYCIKFPTTLFTGKRGDSGSANPALARSAKTRVAFLQETDDEDTIKGGILKELTGGDTFYTRGLFESGGEIVMTFKPILMCNKIPSINNSGAAVRNRTRIVPFMSKWIRDAPSSEAEQFEKRLFPRDNSFEYQIPELARAFIVLLVKYFSIYKDEGLQIPVIVKKATEDYFVENDLYLNFCEDCLERIVDKTGQPNMTVSVGIGQVLPQFRVWYRENYPSQKVPDKPIISNEFKRVLGEPIKKKWFGISIKRPEDNPNNAAGKNTDIPVKVDPNVVPKAVPKATPKIIPKASSSSLPVSAPTTSSVLPASSPAKSSSVISP